MRGGWMRAAAGRGAPVVLDVLIAAVVVVVVLAAIEVAEEPGSRPADALARGLGVAMGMLLLGRRRWPLGVLLGAVALLLAYYALRYPGLSPALPLAVPLYTAAVAGRRWWAAGVAGVFAAAGLFVLGVRLGRPVLTLLVEIAQISSLLFVVVLLGETVRSRRVRLAEAAERLRQVEATRASEAARQVQEERLRIARELHDVMAHTVASISVQAVVAADYLDDRPDKARDALRAIRSSSREATSQIGATLGVLRTATEQEPDRAPAPSLERIEELVATARDAGLEVDVRVEGTPRPLPAAVGMSGYRIVQESLTNVVRHAGAARVSVVLDYGPSELVVDVADDGRGDPGPPGLGLTGMSERAAALGGWLSAGARPEGGFGVRATLPTGAG